MSYLILPARRRIQPVNAARIDRTHPSAYGLRFAMPSPTMGDIVNGNPLTVISGTIDDNASGRVISGNGSAASASIPLDLSSSNKMSMAFWLQWNAYSSGDNFALEFTANTNNNDGSILINPSSSAGSFTIYTRITSTANGHNASFTRPSVGLHHYVLTCDRNASVTGWYAYVDGVQQTVNTVLANYGSSNFANSTLYFFHRNNTLGNYGAGQISGLTFWDRILSADEAKAFYYEGGGWQLYQEEGSRFVSLAGFPAAGTATTVTLDGPSSGVNGVASTDFTVGADGSITGTITVTPADGGNGGTFTPTTVNISNASPTATFTYTPASIGAKSITITNNGLLLNDDAVAYRSLAGVLSVSTPADGRIHQRASGVGTIAVAGTYTGGTPTHVEARVVLDSTSTEVTTWATLSSESISGGNYSGTISGVDEGGWYNVQVRYSNDTYSYYNSTRKVGVGVLVGLTGQSNIETLFMTGSGSPGSLVRYYGRSQSGWQSNSTGAGAANLANALVTALGGTIPVGLLSYAVSSTGLHAGSGYGGADYWLNTANGSPWDAFSDAVTALDGDVEIVVYGQGESDAIAGTWVATYDDDLATLFSRFKTLLGNDVKIVLPLLGQTNSGAATAANWDAVRQNQIAAAALETYVYPISKHDLQCASGSPDLSSTSLQTWGTRLAQTIAYHLGLVAYGHGPTISNVTRYSDTQFDVTIAHNATGTDFVPVSPTNITAIQVKDDGSVVTPTSILRTDATHFRITLPNPASGTVEVQSAFGLLASTSNTLRDNTPLALVLEASGPIEESAVLLADLDATESGSDTFAGTGSLTPAGTISANLDATESGSDTFAGTGTITPAVTTASITITLVNESGTAQSSLSSLKWAWFDQITPNLFTAPTDQGSAEVTDGSGVLTISLPGSSKTSGQVGWLIVTNSDGTTTQSPAHRAFSGPVAVN